MAKDCITELSYEYRYFSIHVPSLARKHKRTLSRWVKTVVTEFSDLGSGVMLVFCTLVISPGVTPLVTCGSIVPD